MKLWLTLTLPLFVLDQITKFAVLKTISSEPAGGISVIPGFFDLVHVHNRGPPSGCFANTSGFSSSSPPPRWSFWR